jgi:hypothetical protein
MVLLYSSPHQLHIAIRLSLVVVVRVVPTLSGITLSALLAHPLSEPLYYTVSILLSHTYLLGVSARVITALDLSLRFASISKGRRVAL